MSKTRHQPLRSCIGCRSVREKRALVRVVRAPDGRLVLDAGGKEPGRGAYVCPARECLDGALRRKAWDRAFRSPVPREAVEELTAAVDELLKSRKAAEGLPGTEATGG